MSRIHALASSTIEQQTAFDLFRTRSPPHNPTHRSFPLSSKSPEWRRRLQPLRPPWRTREHRIPLVTMASTNVARIADAFRSFWHSMTSNDRHASHNSPYRTGEHVPVSQSRHAPLTSVATSAHDSTIDVSTPYHDDSKRPSISSLHMAHSPSRPYSPGMRSMSSPKTASAPQADEVAAPGEIQMQSFADGAPPPPPASHSLEEN